MRGGTGLGSAGLSCSPTLHTALPSTPQTPARGEMRRESLADSGTIVCPLYRENKLR